MFTYCLNNPISLCDPNGCRAQYVISFPADPSEGDGPVEIIDYTGIYSYTVESSNNGIWTYTVTVERSTGTDNKDIIDFIADQLTSFSLEEWLISGGAEFSAALRSNTLLYKNVCTVATANIATFIIYSAQILWDYDQYYNNPKRMAISMTITTVSTLVGLGAGSVLEIICALPVVTATGLSPAIMMGGSFLIGCGISYLEELTRRSFVGETFIY